MRFTDRQKKIICIAIAGAMLLAVVASILLSFVA